MELNDKVISLLQKLEEKYKLDEQDMEAYLEGLLYNNYVDYWHYVEVDALLSLQHPRTDIPDEMVFIMYHQITELYFKLSLWEIKQILENKELTVEFMTVRLKRINAYFQSLTKSFSIMIQGMEPEQFLKFRLSLMPASGFQSAQYRMIEIASTSIIHLVEKSHREALQSAGLEEQFEYIYWKYGATLLGSGKKTLTLKRFEDKYKDSLVLWAKQHESNNLYLAFQKLSINRSTDALNEEMHQFDLNVNVNWPLVHYKSASRYLGQQNEDVPATGGTNWQKYLPPRFQHRIFFPELWSEEEITNWGIRPEKEI